MNIFAGDGATAMIVLYHPMLHTPFHFIPLGVKRVIKHVYIIHACDGVRPIWRFYHKISVGLTLDIMLLIVIKVERQGQVQQSGNKQIHHQQDSSVAQFAHIPFFLVTHLRFNHRIVKFFTLCVRCNILQIYAYFME